MPSTLQEGWYNISWFKVRGLIRHKQAKVVQGFGVYSGTSRQRWCKDTGFEWHKQAEVVQGPRVCCGTSRNRHRE